MHPALLISQLSKTYANGTSALKGISLTVNEGDFFSLLGPNGAGKSTAIGIVCSLVNKTSGEVKIFGHDLDRETLNAKRCIGLVPQEFNFSLFESCLEIVVNQAGYYGLSRQRASEKAEVYLRRLGLWQRRGQQARTLSGGLKRRLMIARALVHEPRLLILDEPTAGVDIEVRREMWDFLKEVNQRGTTIILTSHYLDEVEALCRQVAIIDEGEIVKNTSIKELLQNLHVEIFILDLANPIETPPVISGYETTLRDSTTLEIAVKKQHGLNDLFRQLENQGIQVQSMRNKSNRLEQLFIDLVHKEK